MNMSLDDVKDRLSGVKDGLFGMLEIRRQNKLLLARSKPLRRSPVLNKIIGHRGINFHSDYMEIDGKVAQILTVIDREGADRSLPMFWMTYLIPRNLGDHVEARLIMPIDRMTDKWTSDAQTKSENVKHSQRAQALDTDSSKDAQIANSRTEDLNLISADLNAGDKYLATQLKLFIKASTLNELDAARVRLSQALTQYGFGGVRVVPFEGQQRDEYQNLLAPAMKGISKPQMFTSYELAGAYDLLTHGITDPAGEYVGAMQYDVNNAAVLFDVDNFNESAVIASKDAAQTLSYDSQQLKGNRNSTLWGVKIAQSALINGHNVVHFVLNYTHPEKLGADLSNITNIVDLNRGVINPFQMFGERKDQLSVYSAHSEKLRLMAKQFSEKLEDRDLNRTLPEIIRRFYIHSGIWQDNPKANFDLLRAVTIPNDKYPKLEVFNAYLGQSLQAALQHHQINDVNSIERLQGVFERMENEDGDLFNVHTSDVLTRSMDYAQVFYDFSKLLDRNMSVAMAQLLNTIEFATNQLTDHDVLILHGANKIRKSVKQYIKNHVFQRLRQRGVRIVFLYDSVDDCMDDNDFCQMEHADYTLFGTMTGANIKDYQEIVNGILPAPLSAAIQRKDPTLFFLSRGIDKVIFTQDLVLQ